MKVLEAARRLSSSFRIRAAVRLALPSVSMDSRERNRIFLRSIEDQSTLDFINLGLIPNRVDDRNGETNEYEWA